MSSFKFYIDPEAPISMVYPCFILNYSDWDDYGSRTSFSLSYYTTSHDWVSIGRVKIMHTEENKTIKIIKKEFKELSDDYCSLGQEMNYYEKLKSMFPDKYLAILDALNDVVFYPAVADIYNTHGRFTSSLLRNSEAEKIYKEARNELDGISYGKAFQFSYSCQLPNAGQKHEAEFNFGDNPDLPSRVIGLIGKNGTGKTQFLAKLALDLSGKAATKDFKASFSPHRPYFSKIIAVSFSAFDRFTKPKPDKSFSYKYCGIKDDSGRILSVNKTVENIKASVEKIKDLKRVNDWYDAITEILGEETTKEVYGYFFSDSPEGPSEEQFDLLSSGQTYLVSVISDVIATIKPDSLLLIDEPEMHLHPNAIANLVRMIDKLVNAFQSYSILATHSPLIVQEIPSRYVLVFEREGNIPRIRKLNQESFGESIDVLSEDVFQTRDVQGTYKEVLERLSRFKTYNEINELFDKRLGLSAKTYLLGLYPEN